MVNGSEYNRELYKDLWADVQIKGQYKTEAEWQRIASENNGYCPWYSDGDGTTTFRTPKFAPYQKLALASGESTTNNVPNDIVTLDASKSSPIYGNSTTVQPESNNWIVCVVAFGAATNVGSVDVANVMSAFERLQSLALLKSGGTLTGAVSEKLLSLSGTSVTLDLTSSNNFTHTITANTTFTVSANSDTTFQLGTLVLTNAGSYTITWPESFKWADNTPPTLNESGIDVITFFTIDGGTKYYAVQSITGVA